MAFPYTSQTDFTQIGQEGFAGQRYASEVNDEITSAIVVPVESVSQVTTAQTSFSTTDILGLFIDGGLYITTSNTSNAITAAAWIATNGAALVAAGILSILPTTSVGGLVTLTFADDQAHTVTSYSPATADFTGITNTTSAASTERIVWGQGVTLDTGNPDLISESSQPVRLPSSGTDPLRGILAYTAVNNYPSGLSSQVGAESGYVMPGIMLQLIRKGRVIVDIVGTLPARGAAVYWINNPADPADLGKFRADANGGEADLVAGSFVEALITGRDLAKVYFGASLV